MTNEQSAILRQRAFDYINLCVEVEYNDLMDAHDKTHFLRRIEHTLNPARKSEDETLDEWFARTEEEWRHIRASDKFRRCNRATP